MIGGAILNQITGPIEGFDHLHWNWRLPETGHIPLLMFLAGIWICEQASQILKVHDHPGIVWDEFVGYFITMIAAPPGWIWIVIGFILFRLFDILKPWPIRLIDQQIKGGFGIMADDVLAAVYAWLVLQGFAAVLGT